MSWLVGGRLYKGRLAAKLGDPLGSLRPPLQSLTIAIISSSIFSANVYLSHLSVPWSSACRSQLPGPSRAHMSLPYLHPVGTHLRHRQRLAWALSLSKIHSDYKLFWSEWEPGISTVLTCIVILSLNFAEMRTVYI